MDKVLIIGAWNIAWGGSHPEEGRTALALGQGKGDLLCDRRAGGVWNRPGICLELCMAETEAGECGQAVRGFVW